MKTNSGADRGRKSEPILSSIVFLSLRVEMCSSTDVFTKSGKTRSQSQVSPQARPRAPGIAALVAEELRHGRAVFAAVRLRVGGQQSLKQPPGEGDGFAVGP